MKLKLLLLLAFISQLSFGQKLCTSYNEKIDSTSLARLYTTLKYNTRLNPYMVVFRPEKWIKITIKPMIKTSSSAGYLEDEGDYFGMTKYDIRLKIYINHRFAWVNRWLLDGQGNRNSIYQTGMSFKF